MSNAFICISLVIVKMCGGDFADNAVPENIDGVWGDECVMVRGAFRFDQGPALPHLAEHI